MTDAIPDRRTPIASVPNMRDLGGLTTPSGVVRTDEVYRSTALSHLDETGRELFARLGITTVYDLRTTAERDAGPDAVAAGTTDVHLDVLADNSTSGAASVTDFVTNPDAVAESLGDGKGRELMIATYRDIVNLPSALTAYRSFYLSLLDEDRDGAALFHCTTGKDRTGWAAVSLLTLLGVDETEVRADYLETNTDLAPALKPLLEAASAKGVDPALLQPVLGVDDAYLDAALEEVDKRWGSIESYAVVGLGLGDDIATRLRERFVQADPA